MLFIFDKKNKKRFPVTHYTCQTRTHDFNLYIWLLSFPFPLFFSSHDLWPCEQGDYHLDPAVRSFWAGSLSYLSAEWIKDCTRSPYRKQINLLHTLPHQFTNLHYWIKWRNAGQSHLLITGLFCTDETNVTCVDESEFNLFQRLTTWV